MQAPALKLSASGSTIVELRFSVLHGPKVNIDRIVQLAGQTVDLSFSAKQVGMKLDKTKGGPKKATRKKPLEQISMPGVGAKSKRKAAAKPKAKPKSDKTPWAKPKTKAKPKSRARAAGTATAGKK